MLPHPSPGDWKGDQPPQKIFLDDDDRRKFLDRLAALLTDSGIPSIAKETGYYDRLLTIPDFGPYVSALVISVIGNPFRPANHKKNNTFVQLFTRWHLQPPIIPDKYAHFELPVTFSVSTLK